MRRNGSSVNPLANAGRSTVQRAIGFGVSQSGRFLRDFLHLGFNEDTRGRVVFDGLMPHVAGARRMATNVRFGQPGRNARHPQDPAWQADTFPFTYAVLDDPLSGRRVGLLLRCRLSFTDTPEHARAAATVRSERARMHAADIAPYLDAARRAGARTLHDRAGALTVRGVSTAGQT